MKPEKEPKLCLDCKAPILPTLAKTPVARCAECHRAHKRDTIRRSRACHKQRMLEDGAPPGWKVCTKCLRKKRLSEFSTRLEKGQGKPHKLCDTCLTRIYMGRGYATSGMCALFWRKRAYTCNSSYRATIAINRGVKRSAVSLLDLPWICKPQDLIKICHDQGGKCSYCQVELTENNLTADHAQPRSKNGSHAASNIRLVCTDCNRIKWDRSEVEFREFMQLYSKRFQASELSDKEPRG
jgi:5-methylcytosine-specific restriction endonuclease McrA